MKRKDESKEPICYLVETADGMGREYKYISATKPKDEWASVRPLYTMQEIRDTEYELQSKSWREFKAKVSKWWWLIWTGDQSLSAKRRRIENDARRFGGKITWED